MEGLTNEQRLQIIEFYYKNSCSVKNVFRAFYGRHNRHTEQAIQALVTTFRTNFTLLDIKPPTRIHTEENVAAGVVEDHSLSIRRRSQ